MPPNTHRTEHIRRPDDVAPWGQFTVDQQWQRDGTSRGLWEMAVLWSAAFGEPVDQPVVGWDFG
jgi:hypothetical protein